MNAPLPSISGSILRNQLRRWLLQAAEWHALIAQQSRAASLDDVKKVAAELSDDDLTSLDDSPLRPQFNAEWQPAVADWDSLAKRYAATRHWSNWIDHFGPDPTSKSCRCPPEILQRHGIDPDTGELRVPPRARGE